MFRCLRLAILALGLTVWAGFAASQEADPALKNQPIPEPRQEESASDSEAAPEPEQQPTIDYLPALQAIESAIRDTIPVEDQTKADGQEQRQIADLEAQKDMAFWAEGMFWATAATVALTFAALVAIIRTLYHTRRAADYAADMVGEARKTTEAAVGANEITQRMLVADQRPWVVIDDIAPASPLAWDLNKKEGSFTVRIAVRNTGKTPAVGIWIVANINVRPAKRREILRELCDGARQMPPLIGQTIFPGDTYVQNHIMSISAADLEQSAKDYNLVKDYWSDKLAVHLELMGCADYGLTFDKERYQTRFCLSLRAAPNAGGEIAIGPAWGDTAQDRLYFEVTPLGGISAD